MSELGGAELSGIGFGLGVDRTLLACEAEKLVPLRKGILDVCVIPLESESRTQGVALLVLLRRAGIAADICVDNRSIKSAMKVANNTNAPFVLILGPDEIQTQSVIIKEMSSGDQQSVQAEPATLIPRLQKMLSTLREEQS